MDVKVIRSERKTLSLTVTREGEIVVRAPKRTSVSAIEAFVEKHAGWIEKRLKAVKTAPKLDLRDGAEVTLFGSTYIVKEGKADIRGGIFSLPEEGREAAAVKVLKRFSLEVLSRMTERIAKSCGFSYRAVRISSARGRWGSCNREGVIAYTFRVAFLPPALAEYVVVHELAHTVVFDHSSRFWAVVESILPDFRARRRAARSHPAIGFL